MSRSTHFYLKIHVPQTVKTPSYIQRDTNLMSPSSCVMLKAELGTDMQRGSTCCHQEGGGEICCMSNPSLTERERERDCASVFCVWLCVRDLCAVIHRAGCPRDDDDGGAVVVVVIKFRDSPMLGCTSPR